MPNWTLLIQVKNVEAAGLLPVSTWQIFWKPKKMNTFLRASSPMMFQDRVGIRMSVESGGTLLVRAEDTVLPGMPIIPRVILAEGYLDLEKWQPSGGQYPALIDFFNQVVVTNETPGRISPVPRLTPQPVPTPVPPGPLPFGPVLPPGYDPQEAARQHQEALERERETKTAGLSPWLIAGGIGVAGGLAVALMRKQR